MRIYNTATDVIKQGGAKRESHMGVVLLTIMMSLSVSGVEGRVTNFNISVALTDAFMDSLKNNGEYELTNRGRTIIGKIRAQDVLMKIVKVHGRQEIGLIFIDRINRDNPPSHRQYGIYKSVR